MSNDSSFFKDSGATSEISTNLAQRAIDAETAKTAAEAAKVAAETAASNAEASANSAQTSLNTVVSSSNTASASATTATTKASEAATSASNASSSASQAATSASNASTSETNAATSATTASTAATSAQSAQTAAETAKTAAETAQTAAEAAKTSAETAETNATSASTSSSNSAATAATQATTATTKAGEAATSATNAATSEANAATSETNAATSETNASTSATNAATSETNSATSASTANTQAGIATTKAGEASTSASNAQTAQTASESARDLALSYRNTAETHKDAAAVSSATATTQAGVSSSQATISTTKAGEASSSASSAASAQTAAEAARDSALTALDNFDDRYLGSKTSDPAVDNDGNALVGGSLFFDSTNGIMKVYTGSAWVAAYASTAGTLLVANNLSDVQSAATSRTNLGLSTVAATGAYSDLTGTPTLFDGAFSSLSGTPTTISGYGITDALQLGTSATTALAGNTSIPSSLTDLGISDGTNGQALKTDGSGNFSFGDVSSSVAFADITGKPTTISGYGITDAFDGAYGSLTGTPTIPTNNNQLTNGAGYITSADGGNAATLDSLDSTSFLRSDADDSVTGAITFPLTGFKISDQVTVSHSTDQTYKTLTIKNEGDDNEASIDGLSSDGTRQFMVYGGAQSQGFLHPVNYSWRLKIPLTGSLSRDNAYTIWDSGNDGSGSGLDADTLDGIQGSSFLRSDTDDSMTGLLTLGTSSSLSGQGALSLYRSSNPWIGWYSGSTSRGAYLQYVGSGDYFLFGEASYTGFDCNIRHEGQYNYNDTNQYIWWTGQTYGNFRCGGGNVNSYSGIEFSDSSSDTTLMIRNSDGLNGFYRADAGTWFWYSDSSNHFRSYGNVTAYASDERLKTFYGTIESPLEKICQIDGLYYEWDEEACSKTDFTPVFNKMEIGLKAQQVEALFPEVVELAPFDTDPMDKGVDQSKSGENYLTLHYERLVPVLIEAIKELKAEIDVLKGVEND